MSTPIAPDGPLNDMVAFDGRVDAAGQDSFPASDAPSWWSGPSETATGAGDRAAERLDDDMVNSPRMNVQ
jgi:hypothetical protein